MTMRLSPDKMVTQDDWSDLRQFRDMPTVDFDRLHRYRTQRLREQMQERDVAMCVMVSPVSLRYAVNYRNYALFMSHIPSTYLFFPMQGEFIIHGAFDPNMDDKKKRLGQPISYFYGGENLSLYAQKLAAEVDEYLSETNAANRRIALEYINPSVTQALHSRNIEVVDGVLISERARLIKSADEIACIRWAIAVAEHGSAKVKEALQPGVSELQLWALLNYTNLANNGDWHDGRMLASGHRINPWLQEASERILEDGDLMGFDTDMIGPLGYCADLSRTFYCGDSQPSVRQKELYRLAVDEIEHNLTLIKPGVSFLELQQNAYPVAEQYRHNAYPSVIHGVGMCDEYPNIPHGFREPPLYKGHLEAGMVLCIESYMGAVGERDGVKLEQQVLVTETGYEQLTAFPYEAVLLA